LPLSLLFSSLTLNTGILNPLKLFNEGRTSISFRSYTNFNS